MKRLTNITGLEVVSRHRGGRVEVVNERGEMRIVHSTALGRVVTFSISSSAWMKVMTEASLIELREARLMI